MPRALLRAVIFLLIPGMICDPAFASSFAGLPTPLKTIPQNLFLEQTLALDPVASEGQPSLAGNAPLKATLDSTAAAALKPPVRVVGIFVHMPNGDVVVHVRAHWKSKPFMISALSGHVEEGETASEAALRETAEELGFPKNYRLTGTLTELAKDQALPGDAKDERIDIFRYTLSDAPNDNLGGASEATVVTENMEKLRAAQVARTEEEYKAYLEGLRDANPGDGEVWRIYAFPMDQLVRIAHDGSAVFPEQYAHGVTVDRKVGMVGGLAYVLKLPDMEAFLNKSTEPRQGDSSSILGIAGTILSVFLMVFITTGFSPNPQSHSWVDGALTWGLTNWGWILVGVGAALVSFVFFKHHKKYHLYQLLHPHLYTYEYLSHVPPGQFLHEENAARNRIVTAIFPLAIQIIKELRRKGLTEVEALEQYKLIVSKIPREILHARTDTSTEVYGDYGWHDPNTMLRFSYPSRSHLKSELYKLKLQRSA